MPHGLDLILLLLVLLLGLHPGDLAHLCSPLGQICGASLNPCQLGCPPAREVLESGAVVELALGQDEEGVGLADGLPLLSSS